MAGARIKGRWPGSNGFYVTNKIRKSFEVREQQRRKNSVVFSYRIVAKRKDISGPRLAKVTLPPSGNKRPKPILPGNLRRPLPQPS